MAKQKLSSWLYGSRWDVRQRAKRYKEDHVIGEGWKEDLGAVVQDVVVDGSEGLLHKAGRKYRFIPGIKRETAIASIDPDNIANAEWPIEFTPSYTNKSWRSRLGKWKTPATPMISNIKANHKKGIMLVTFGSDGAQVMYDHVPREVIAQLQYAAQSGESLGKAFWDLVRYRGHTEGSKYSYWYASKGTAPEKQMMSQEERDWLDSKVYEALRLYDEGTDQRNMLSADEVEHWVTRLSDAYDSEDYHKMAQIYLAGKKQGFYE